MKNRNTVAKHMETFNRPVTHKDRKKEERKGKRKNKKLCPKDVD